MLTIEGTDTLDHHIKRVKHNKKKPFHIITQPFYSNIKCFSQNDMVLEEETHLFVHILEWGEGRAEGGVKPLT